jgi:hypothetical protein
MKRNLSCWENLETLGKKVQLFGKTRVRFKDLFRFHFNLKYAFKLRSFCLFSKIQTTQKHNLLQKCPKVRRNKHINFSPRF